MQSDKEKRKTKAARLNCETFPMEDFERSLLEDIGIVDLVEVEGESQEEITEAAKDADAVLIIAAKVRQASIEEMEKCRILCRYGTGVDNIDVDVATEKGIIVTNVPDFCVNEMAEHAMSLLLGVVRRTQDMHRTVLEGDWISVRMSKELHRIAGKKMGLIGFGNVGKALAVRAKAFDIEVVDYHRHVNPEEEKKYGVTPVSLETLLKESDYVMVLCPLTPETEGMIGEKELNMLKKEAILVNIARGAIIDEYALAKALKERRIAAAGIDVFYHLNMFKEPGAPPRSPYFELDNILLSPHIGGTSVESMKESFSKALGDLKRVMNGQWPKNCVNTEVRPWFDIDRPGKA